VHSERERERERDSIASKLWRFSFSFVLKATGAKKISEFQDFASPTASVAELMGTFSD